MTNLKLKREPPGHPVPGQPPPRTACSRTPSRPPLSHGHPPGQTQDTLSQDTLQDTLSQDTLQVKKSPILKIEIGNLRYPYSKEQIKTIEARFRRRLRARIVSQQKRRRHLFNKLKKNKVKPKAAARAAFSNNGRWHLSREKVVEQAFPNKWFIQRGMLIRSRDQLPHWLSDNYWVHLT